MQKISWKVSREDSRNMSECNHMWHTLPVVGRIKELVQVTTNSHPFKCNKHIFQLAPISNAKKGAKVEVRKEDKSFVLWASFIARQKYKKIVFIKYHYLLSSKNHFWWRLPEQGWSDGAGIPLSVFSMACTHFWLKTWYRLPSWKQWVGEYK